MRRKSGLRLTSVRDCVHPVETCSGRQTIDRQLEQEGKDDRPRNLPTYLRMSEWGRGSMKWSPHPSN